MPRVKKILKKKEEVTLETVVMDVTELAKFVISSHKELNEQRKHLNEQVRKVEQHIKHRTLNVERIKQTVDDAIHEVQNQKGF